MTSRLHLPLAVVTLLALVGCAHAPRPGTVLTIAGAAATLTGVAIAMGGSSCQQEPQPSCDENASDANVGWPIAGVGAAVLIGGIVWMALDTSGTSSASGTGHREPLSGAMLSRPTNANWPMPAAPIAGARFTQPAY